jgi:hypothetical protein
MWSVTLRLKILDQHRQNCRLRGLLWTKIHSAPAKKPQFNAKNLAIRLKAMNNPEQDTLKNQPWKTWTWMTRVPTWT